MNKELDGAITINVDFAEVEKRIADMMGGSEVRMSEISSETRSPCWGTSTL